MLPFKRSLDEDNVSLLRPQPTFKGDSMIDKGLKILLKRCCITVSFVVVLFVLLALLNNQTPRATIEADDLTIEADKIIWTTSDKFLSIGLDTSLIKGRWYHYNSEKLLLAAKYLAPAHLRMGGTDSDRLIFSANSPHPPSHNYFDDALLIAKAIAESIKKKNIGVGAGETKAEDSFNFPEIERNYDNFTMTGEDWTKIYTFAKKAGFNILFDLNVLLRDGDDWDSSNAEELIKFSNDNGFDVNWQLGNEPNSFHHVFNVTINGTQLGKDFNKLRNILNKYPRYANNTLMVGPDVTRPKKFPVDSSTKYLTDFLKSVAFVDAVTWHHYYLNGRNTSLAEFVNPEVFNILRKQISAMKSVVNSLNITAPMWLAETASAYGGGAPGLSDRFVDGFLWLDKLGIAAQMGLDVVIRQSLYQGYYALLDPDMNPLPDWWLSVMYKRFVGPEVLKTAESEGPVRLYCHCTAADALLKPSGTVTMFGINMMDQPTPINVRAHLPATRSSLPALAYFLTGKDGLLSKATLLNGEELRLNPDGTLPPFKPNFFMSSDEITMPPESIAFFVLHDLTVPVCRKKSLW